MQTTNMFVVDGRRHVIETCPYCGVTNALASKSLRRCTTCADRWRRYSECKALCRDDPSPEHTDQLVRIVAEYKRLGEAGYKVPRDIQSLLRR